MSRSRRWAGEQQDLGGGDTHSRAPDARSEILLSFQSLQVLAIQLSLLALMSRGLLSPPPFCTCMLCNFLMANLYLKVVIFKLFLELHEKSEAVPVS